MKHKETHKMRFLLLAVCLAIATAGANCTQKEFMNAVSNGNDTRVEECLQEGRIDVNGCSYGLCPLGLAAQNVHYDRTSSALKDIFNYFFPGMISYTTPRVRVIEVLLEHGADRSQVNYRGHNATTSYKVGCMFYEDDYIRGILNQSVSFI